MAKISHAELLRVHFDYEVGMLTNTHKCLLGGVPDETVRNALIESFCIHARNLDDFFHSKQGVQISDFTTPEYIPFRKGDIGKTLRSKLNNQVAHLTYARTSDLSKKIGDPDRDILFKLLDNEVWNFCAHLKPEYYNLMFPDAQPTSTMTIAPSEPQATNAVTLLPATKAGGPS